MYTYPVLTPTHLPFVLPELDQAHTLLPELMEELYRLVSQLGSDGGCLTPSIYDTAQVLRLAPPQEGVEPGLAWLLKNQQTDGGWGNPVAPLMRDVPTLAAVLALHQYKASGAFNEAIDAGLAFLRRSSEQWQDFSVDELLVGVELILPTLIEEAIQYQLDISSTPYLKLHKIGMHKRKMIQNLKVIHGTPAAFSWEAWGDHPDRYLVDAYHSVGSSTSATAAWIARVRHYQLPFDVTQAQHYLHLASQATGVNIPGVVPFAWPIDRFEQSFGLYALATGGLLSHPALEEVLNQKIHALYGALTPYGMPFTDTFIPDLDDTAAAIVVFREAGLPVKQEVLRVFQNEVGFFTYPGEFHASTSAHARAVQALKYLAEAEVMEAKEVLLSFQQEDGTWPGDKWHKSWLYTTSHMLYALQPFPDLPAADKGLGKLLAGQNDDGGWGVDHTSSTAETAYVMLALQQYRKQNPELEFAYRRGQTWLMQNFYRTPAPTESLWIGKELFKPFRIDRAFELTALIQAILSP